MKYKELRNIIINHLADYKKTVLNVDECGVWKKDGLPREHILPLEKGELNYLCDSARLALLFEERHSDWNHLNSSQTLCVNFFAPLLEDRALLSKLMSSLLNIDIDVAKAKFEHIEREYSTNFDFYFEDTKSHNYYFEIKYTEDGVTKSGGGKDPINAYSRFYEKDVKENPLFKNITPEMFMSKHYQAYRNMVKAKNGDYSIFITMKSNVNTFKELTLALKDLKVENTTGIVLIYWEELIDEVIVLFSSNYNLKNYYTKLKEKYIPFNLD